MRERGSINFEKVQASSRRYNALGAALIYGESSSRAYSRGISTRRESSGCGDSSRSTARNDAFSAFFRQKVELHPTPSISSFPCRRYTTVQPCPPPSEF